MKLHLLDRSSVKNSSFNVSKNSYPYFLKIWHYHPELELVVVLKSTGTRFIGDSIEKFEEGEVVLIGKNLPHMWLNDEIYFQEQSDLLAEDVAIHFKEEFLGNCFQEAPEMKHIADLFNRAKKGIRFYDLEQDVIDQIIILKDLSPFNRTVKFIEILDTLANHREFRLLSSSGFISSHNRKEQKDLDKIYEFVYKNFNRPINSSEVAAVVNMNPSSFSRFFKRIHQKPFTRYLNEIRIGFACKQLLKNKSNVSSACYDSGFNNISNFNRQFKLITGMSPTSYVDQHTRK